MEILLLTTLFSVVFAVLFLSLFLRERQVRGFGGVEREALMPLDDGDEPKSEASVSNGGKDGRRDAKDPTGENFGSRGFSAAAHAVSTDSHKTKN